MNNNISSLLPETYDAVILAAGEFPTHVLPIRILKHAKLLFVCDGALADLLELGITPTAVIGDGDSLSPSLKEQFKDIYHQVDEQESNDLTKATHYALEHLRQTAADTLRPRICYLGASGKREDHTLANIALMMHYFDTLGIQPTMATDYGWFTPACGNATFRSFAGQQVSIFNFSCKELSSNGLKWNIYPFGHLWQGTLNEALGKSFTIRSDGEYLVYRTYQGKTA